MKVPMKWLKEYVDVDIPVEEYAHRMVMSGSEVEDVEKLGENMQNVVVGRVISLEKHPDADRLQVCQMDIGEKVIQVVTGATNVSAGAVVPVAKVGAILPNGMQIKAGKLRGVDSFGMLCSAEELCLPEEDEEGAEHGILLLQQDVNSGMDMREVLGLNDVVVEFKTLANRPDCMSVRGIARETAATLQKPIHFSKVNFMENNENILEYIQISVDDEDLCPRYTARVVKNIKIGPSPLWMQQYLKHAGVRPINNVVDITNYVMLDMGQPMHAFDMRDIRGKQIIVRRANKGETLITLDEKKRVLTKDMLVIADAEGAIGLAGVMGGMNSEVKDDTTTVLLESACFKQSNIRITGRALGLRSESSARFEKGVDIAATKDALCYAVQLLCDLCGGEAIGGDIDIYPHPQRARILHVNPEKINALVGLDIPFSSMIQILNTLHMQARLENGEIVIQVPSYRGDMEGMADVAEEILRLYGYDKLGSTLHPTSESGLRTIAQQDIWKVREVLAGFGLSGITTYSFSSPHDYAKLNLEKADDRLQNIPLLNPLGEELSVMRTTLIPNMLQVLSTNLNRKAEMVSLFEIGAIYQPKSLPLQELPDEKVHICLGLAGEQTDFYRLKGIIEALLDTFRIHEVRFIKGCSGFLHPGRSAKILAGKICLGEFGELHPDVQSAFDIPTRVYVAELDAIAIFNTAQREKPFVALPKYPTVQRDIALITDKNSTIGEITDCIVKFGGGLLQGVKLFDIYEGKQIEDGKKSVAFSLTFLSDDHTLVDDEVNQAFNQIVVGLGKEMNAQIRK